MDESDDSNGKNREKNAGDEYVQNNRAPSCVCWREAIRERTNIIFLQSSHAAFYAHPSICL